MKRFPFSILLLALFFLTSCVDRRVALPPEARVPQTPIPSRVKAPPQNLPRIGTGVRAAVQPRPAALDAMISQAKGQLARHQPGQAFQTLERALAIDGQDPMVWHLMARARQAQGLYGQAESLARKSNTLAGKQVSLRKKNWQIIADMLEKQGRADEAEAARKNQ